MPSSETTSLTRPSLSWPRARRIVPPRGMASTALLSRLSSTCSSWSASNDNQSALDHALTDGEDFELLLALPAAEAHRLVAEGVALTGGPSGLQAQAYANQGRSGAADAFQVAGSQDAPGFGFVVFGGHRFSLRFCG